MDEDLTRATHPVPEVYRILGNLKNFGSSTYVCTSCIQVNRSALLFRTSRLGSVGRAVRCLPAVSPYSFYRF